MRTVALEPMLDGILSAVAERRIAEIMAEARGVDDFAEVRRMHAELVCARHKLNEFGMHPSDFGEIVHAACLGHDLGNPPFGHSGEDAIQHWFKSDSPHAKRTREGLTPTEIADVERYEGNAQGFR